MRKYPSEVSVSKNCINANLEMVERWDQDNFLRLPPQECCTWTIPEIALKMDFVYKINRMENLSFLCRLGSKDDT